MRVLYVINAFVWGGAEKLVYDLSLGMTGKVEWIGIAALYRNSSRTEMEMMQTLEKHGIYTLILDKGAGTDRMASIKKLYRYAHCNRVNIIHGHCSVPMLFSKIVGKILCIPVVCTIHNTTGYSRKKEMLTAWMVNVYISIGQAAEDYMVRDLKICEKKIHRIYNAIETSRFENRKRDPLFWKQYGGKENQITFINVARVTEQKNQMCLLRAVKRLIDRGKTDIRIYFLGYYEPADPVVQKLNEYIQKNGLRPYVEFLGMHRNVCDFLANADCFVMTSWYEGLSVAFLEAVISGIPIVTTDMPFVQELNTFAECATVIPQNDDRSLAAVLYKKTYKRQTQQTINQFKSHFSMEEFVRKHLEVYQKCCCAQK